MESYKIELAKKNGTQSRLYPDLVSEYIRKKYSINAELALLRQREEKPEEFAAYNAYAEQCKREARRVLGMEEGDESNES
ncbi:MAG: hypothetical protein E7643_01460 [Ruminococcaceae bacterium]|nr:hypothetical protein [Oscillospiraceae bacterium]